MIGTTTQKAQIALYTVALILATLAVACRLWARRITGLKWQVNDWLMILAYVNVVGLAIAANLAVIVGELSIRYSDIPADIKGEIYPFNMKMTVVIPFFLITSSYLTKLSITHFYITLFPHTTIHAICRLQFVLLILTGIASIIRLLTLCRPFAFAWNPRLDGKCGDFKDFSLETSVVALVFDIACVVLPIPVVWRLKLEMGKKIRLTVLFGLGILICIITALRIYYTERMDFADLTRTAAPAVMFSVPEPALSIVAGCLPIIVPLYRLASNKLTSSITKQVRRRVTEKKRNSWNTKDAKKLSLQCHPSYLYPFPCAAVVVSRGSDYDSVSPLTLRSPFSFRCAGVVSPESAIRPGITVLTEVRVDSARASWVR